MGKGREDDVKYSLLAPGNLATIVLQAEVEIQRRRTGIAREVLAGGREHAGVAVVIVAELVVRAGILEAGGLRRGATLTLTLATDVQVFREDEAAVDVDDSLVCMSPSR